MSSLTAAKNPFLVDLCNLMRNEEFMYFRQHYMKDWSDIETIFMFMFVYDYISTEYSKRFHRSITDCEMTRALQLVFTSHQVRPIVQAFREMQNLNKKPLLSIIRPALEMKPKKKTQPLR